MRHESVPSSRPMGAGSETPGYQRGVLLKRGFQTAR